MTDSTKEAKAEKGLEPVGFVMGWHVTVGDPHTDVRLDVRLYSGRRHQFKAGDHIYAHPPTQAEKGLQPVNFEDLVTTTIFEAKDARAGLRAISKLTTDALMAQEKGLEPVAQVELIEETANEFPMEFRQRVRDAMMNAWVGGYNECLDEESSHHERVSPEEEAAVEAALAHPPTQVEPVAIDALFELAGWPEGGDIDAFAFQDWAVKYGYLKPETRTEPCGENCFCLEYHGEDGFEGGVTCYRRAHPPTQVEPVVSKSVDAIADLVVRYGDDHSEANFKMLVAAIVAYGDTQWNDALAAVKDAVLDDPDADPLHIIAGLKREPR